MSELTKYLFIRNEIIGLNDIIKVKHERIVELKTELEARTQKHWADMNTARCLLLNFIEDLTALAEDMRLKELGLKKILGRTEQ